jgi:acetyl esterase
MSVPEEYKRWLDAEMQDFVARSEAFYATSEGNLGIAEAREAYDRMCAGLRAPRDEAVAVEDGLAETPIALRRYRPLRQRLSASLLYVHGGGFVLGGLESHDDICAEFCAGTGMEVVAVEYRLAPEHPYPAALDDVFAAHQRLMAESHAVIVAGDSAGGTLAAALCHRLRRVGAPQPLGQVLIYPLLSPNPLRVVGSRLATAPMLSAGDCQSYLSAYAGNAKCHDDAEFTPLAANNFAGLAPAAIFAAGYDPLRQDAADYAALLHAAGVPVYYREDPGLVHGWLRARHSANLAARAFADVLAAVNQLGLEARRD